MLLYATAGSTNFPQRGYTQVQFPKLGQVSTQAVNVRWEFRVTVDEAGHSTAHFFYTCPRCSGLYKSAGSMRGHGVGCLLKDSSSAPGPPPPPPPAPTPAPATDATGDEPATVIVQR